MTHTTTAPVLLIKVGENVLVRTTEDWQESNLKALRARFGAKRVQPLAVSTFDAAEAGARGIAVYRNKDAYMRAENANDAVEAALLPDEYLNNLLASGNNHEAIEAQYQGLAA